MAREFPGSRSRTAQPWIPVAIAVTPPTPVIGKNTKGRAEKMVYEPIDLGRKKQVDRRLPGALDYGERVPHRVYHDLDAPRYIQSLLPGINWMTTKGIVFARHDRVV